MATNGSFTQQDQYKNENEQYSSASNQIENSKENSSSNELTKDEVGWYFVEQFYTTLSKNPEKLHLFYGLNSQFVFGLEAEVSSVAVGREAIQERIKELDFKECKVRVSNVDSQASFNCIVIQVIGETSSLSAEPKKFVQTFVLAQQPTGYFVLNDIFRYITEEGEEEVILTKQDETVTSSPLVEESHEKLKEEPVNESSSTSLNVEVAEVAVDAKLDKTIDLDQSHPETITTNGTSDHIPPTPSVPPSIAEEKTTKLIETEEFNRSEQEKKFTEKDLKGPEKPQDSSTPTAAAANAQPTSKPVTPIQPGIQKPMSWASRAAAAMSSGPGPKPAVPVVAPKNTANPNRAVSTNTKNAQSTNKTSNAQNEKEKENNPPGSGWQTAGESLKRQNRPQSISGPPEKEGILGYVRNVTNKVDINELRTVLNTFGTLTYFDVNSNKNCAFIEYATTEGYQAANNANPHIVSGEQISVEPRKSKNNSYNGNGFSGRGGTNQRGRGSFANRSRGSGTTRTRGQSNNP